MNKFCSQFAASLVALFAAANSLFAQPSDGIVFRNGDVLYGKLLAIQPRGAVRWQHPDAAEPIEFKLDSVAQIDFAGHKAASATGSCRAYCGNGDSFEGDVIAGDRDSVVFDTRYAGKLKVARKALQSLAFSPREPVVFAGIDGLEGWTQGSAQQFNLPAQAYANATGQWLCRNGAFYADKSASIARDVKLPDVADIQFDLAWKGALNLAVALYTDSLQPIALAAKENGPDFGGFYSLRFTYTVTIGLTPIRKNDPIRTLGDLIVPSLNQKDRLHVDVRVSKPQHRIFLYFDGALIKEWNDTNGFAGEGTGVRFVQQSMGGTLKLANLRVTKWNGILEPAAAPSDGTHDTVSLESGAKISGDIEAIANGQVTVKSSSGSEQIPLSKITGMEFARLPGEAPKPLDANVHVTLAQGGALTVKLLDWKPDAAVMESPAFGKATFDPASFSRLKFLPFTRKESDEPKS
ncbi:MAG: hypothetical protein ACLQVY_17060 [Limisphaerales bacterium]